MHNFIKIIFITSAIASIFLLNSCDNSKENSTRPFNKNGVSGEWNMNNGTFSGRDTTTGRQIEGKILTQGLTGNTVELKMGGERQIYENKLDISTGKQVTKRIE